jgi:hypothetical protein
MARVRRARRLFAVELRASVDLDRIRRIALAVGGIAAVEHVVRRHVDDHGVDGGCSFGDVPGAGSVDGGGPLGFGLAGVDVGHRRAMNNE